jgi:predicted small lipoprotein YifL
MLAIPCVAVVAWLAVGLLALVAGLFALAACGRGR